MESISTRFSRTVFLVMFLLIGFNLLRNFIPDKDGNQLVHTMTSVNTSRKLLRAPLLRHIPPSPRANDVSHFVAPPIKD
ncbi:hypothetical protein MKW94_014752 [Papaver nudicaule]|uniref:Uncharacterized protein n=1 Tax=Papaver nudicaule TaxID=74823 RepID=A0AA42B034_PAPNU|nr:hypothetical protein [Papaver nudicaule]